MDAKQFRTFETSLAGSSDGVFHLAEPFQPARVLSWETVRAFVAGRGGCPCPPGSATAWDQYCDHLRAVLQTSPTAPDHAVEANYGPDGRKVSETVGAWRTVQTLLAAHGATCVKPSPRKTMIVPGPAGSYIHAAVEWLSQVSPSGERLFRITFYRH